MLTFWLASRNEESLLSADRSRLFKFLSASVIAWSLSMLPFVPTAFAARELELLIPESALLPMEGEVALIDESAVLLLECVFPMLVDDVEELDVVGELFPTALEEVPPTD